MRNYDFCNGACSAIHLGNLHAKISKQTPDNVVDTTTLRADTCVLTRNNCPVDTVSSLRRRQITRTTTTHAAHVVVVVNSGIFSKLLFLSHPLQKGLNIINCKYDTFASEVMFSIARHERTTISKFQKALFENSKYATVINDILNSASLSVIFIVYCVFRLEPLTKWINCSTIDKQLQE